jgi:hypothetical protein
MVPPPVLHDRLQRHQGGFIKKPDAGVAQHLSTLSKRLTDYVTLWGFIHEQSPKEDCAVEKRIPPRARPGQVIADPVDEGSWDPDRLAELGRLGAQL